MLTMMLVALTVLGSGDMTSAESIKERRDPFVPVRRLSSNWTAYIEARAVRYGAPVDHVRAVLADPRITVTRPERPKARFSNWDTWKQAKLTPEAIHRGARLLEEHQGVLDAIESRWHVDRRWIIGTYWVESDFGDELLREEGTQPAFNTLYSRAYHAKPKHRAWWAQNVAALIAICWKLERDLFTERSSYAGAIGPMQFMPKTWMDYGMTLRTAAVPDPWNLFDAMVSSAHYLVDILGWRGNDHAKRLCAHAQYNAGPRHLRPIHQDHGGYALAVSEFVQLLQAHIATTTPRASLR